MTLLEQLQASAAKVTAEKLETVESETFEFASTDGDEGTVVSLAAGVDDDLVPIVTLCLEPGIGKQTRFLDMHPAGARALCARILAFTDKIEEITNVKPNPTGSP
jgi:NAD kinase